MRRLRFIGFQMHADMPVAQSWQARRAEHLHVCVPRMFYTSCPSSEGKACSARPCTSPSAADRTALSALS